MLLGKAMYTQNLGFEIKLVCVFFQKSGGQKVLFCNKQNLSLILEQIQHFCFGHVLQKQRKWQPKLEEYSEGKIARSTVSLKAGPEIKSLFCSQKLQLVPPRWDLCTSSYKIFIAINRESFYISGVDSTGGKALSLPEPSAFLVNLGMNETVRDIFFLPLFSACKNSFDRGSKINSMEEGMNQEGTKHIF